MNGDLRPDANTGTEVGSRNDVDPPIEWLTLDEAAERLGTTVRKVKQLIRDGELAAVAPGGRGGPRVPARFIVDGEPLRGLGGTLTVLHDAGYTSEESVRWLFSESERLEDRPVELLAAGRIKTVRRVAQTLAF